LLRVPQLRGAEHPLLADVVGRMHPGALAWKRLDVEQGVGGLAAGAAETHRAQGLGQRAGLQARGAGQHSGLARVGRVGPPGSVGPAHQWPSKLTRAVTGAPAARTRSAPPRSGRSTMKPAPATSAAASRNRAMAARAVPPVAIRSSISSTRSPGATASRCISMQSEPYSRAYSTARVA